MRIGLHIAAPAEAVWHTLCSFRQWPLWGPSVRKVQCDQTQLQSDSSGRVQTLFGFWLPFEVTGYSPGHYWKWKVGGIDATGHRVIPMGKNNCRLEFEFPLWAFPYGIVCHIAARRIARLCQN